MDQCDSKINLVKYMWVSVLYFTSSDFACILKTIWYMNIIIRDYESVWPNDDLKINVTYISRSFGFALYQNKYRSTLSLCHGLVILLIIFKIIWWVNIIVGIMDQCDAESDLAKYMWVSDLYFMVHWFCLLSLSLIFLYIKKWRRPGIFGPLQSLALVSFARVDENIRKYKKCVFD